MRLPLVFAIRYVFSKKKTTAITLISFITALAFAIGAAAMIIILSAFNGFETTITNLFTSFDPALKIEAIMGKNFTLSPGTNSELKKIKGVASIAEVVEDNAVVKYGEAQEIVIIKGVSANYNLVTQIDSTIVEGKFLLEGNGIKTGVFGYELASKLGSRPVRRGICKSVTSTSGRSFRIISHASWPSSAHDTSNSRFSLNSAARRMCNSSSAKRIL